MDCADCLRRMDRDDANLKGAKMRLIVSLDDAGINLYQCPRCKAIEYEDQLRRLWPTTG